MAVQYETYETYDTMDTEETVEPALGSRGASIILKAIKAQDKKLVLPRRLYCLLSGLLAAIVLMLVVLTALTVVIGINRESSTNPKDLMTTTTSNSTAATPQPALSNSACLHYKILDSVSRNVATLAADS